MSRIGSLVAWAVLVSQAALLARGWERLDRCEFFEGASSDGDSIEVHRGSQQYIFRLYFVDCVEKNPLSGARRREQGKYFGLKSSEGTPLRAAYLAKNFTKDKLREPFTIFTRWQRVDPGGENPAFRAFVETADGEDLATLLVTEGLAIIRHGESAVSDHPKGQSSEQISSDLRRAEAEARARKRGAWGLASENDRAEDVLMATDREGAGFARGHESHGARAGPPGWCLARWEDDFHKFQRRSEGRLCRDRSRERPSALFEAISKGAQGSARR